MLLRFGTPAGAVSRWKLKKMLPSAFAAMAGLTGIASWAFAQQPTPPMPMTAPALPGQVVPSAATPSAPSATAPPQGAAAAPQNAPPEKRVSVNFKNAHWDTVLDWFAAESGLIPILTVKPTSSVTIQPPKDRTYTIGEVVDLLNEAMQQQRFILIRRHVSFFIHPSDEKLDTSLVPRIELTDLPSRGKTEIVQVLVPLKTLNVEDTAPEIKNLLTPFGSISSLAKTNTLVIVDSAGNIRRIVEMIDEIQKDAEKGESYTHKCLYKKAQEMSELLKTHLADSTVTVAGMNGGAASPFMPNFGGSFGGYDPNRMGGAFPGGMPGMGGGDPRGGDGNGSRGSRGNPGSSGRSTKTSATITVDVKANSVTVVGPPDKIQLAKKLIEDADKPQYANQKPIVVSDPILRKYPVPPGTADAYARTLQPDNPSVKILALPTTNELLVLATDEDHKAIEAKIGTQREQASTATTVIRLASTDPAEMLSKLKANFPSAANGGPVIDTQVSGQDPGIVVKGTLTQIKDVQDFINVLEGTTGSGAGNFQNRRVISFPDGSTSILAEKLAQMFDDARMNPVKVIDPNSPPKPTFVVPLPRNPGVGPAPQTPMPLPPGKQSAAPIRGDVAYVNAQIVDPEKPKSDKKPVFIEVRGNQLIITSEDTAALDLITNLARYYTGVKPEENLFKVIRLKRVPAEDVAKTITEIFNGPQQAQRGGGLGGLAGGPLGLLGALAGGGGSGPPVPAGVNTSRIRVVAEKSSNSLVVIKASPIDLLTIEKLVSEYVDRGVVDDTITPRFWPIAIRYASAYEVADRVRELFRTLTTTTQQQPATPLPFVAPQAQVSAKPPQLTVTVDERTNKVLLYCSEDIYREVLALVESALDVPDVANPEVVKTVRLEGIDPALVQQAIDAFQGRNPLANQRMGNGAFGNRNGFGGNGFAGGPGMGGGGFGAGPGMGAFGGGPGMGGGGFGAGPGMGAFGGAGPGFGGGGMGPGMGGGGRGAGGGAVPGGGRGGGGAPGGGRGGTGRQASAAGAEGPLNFDDRGMDAPLAPVSYTLYDPMIEGTEQSSTGYLASRLPSGRLPISETFRMPVAAQVPQQPQPVLPMNPPVRPGQVVPVQGGPPAAGQAGNVAPRGNVTAYSLYGLDTLVIRAENQQDLQIILELIEYLRELSKAAQPRLQVVQLEYTDCNVAADFLTQLFSRVVVAGPGGIYSAAAGAAQQQGAFGAPGAFGGIGGAAAQVQNRGFYFLAIPSQSSILVVGPESRFDDILREIRRIDVPHSQYSRPKPFALKRASAQIVATQLQTFFNTRFPGEPQTKTQFRVTYDTASNTVWVQASRADLEDVEMLIADWDTTESQAVNDVRLFKIRNADAAGLAQVLTNALSAHVVNPLGQQTFAGPLVQAAGGTSGLVGGGLPGVGLGGQIGAGLPGGAGLAGFGGAGAAGLGAGATTNVQVTATVPTVGSAYEGALVTRNSSLRFVYGDKDGETAVVSGLLTDIHLVPNIRTNVIIVAAPEKTMKLIAKLIDQLDTPPAIASYVNIYTLRNADANLTANLLRSLFTGTTTGTGTGTGAGGGGAAGATAGGAGGAAGGTNATTLTRSVLSDGGSIADGAALVGLQIAVDDRTNSLIVAGSQTDLDTIRGIIAKLDASDTPDRYYDVFKLRNSAAADVATALTTFITNSLAVLSGTNFYTTYIQLQKNVVIVAEPVSNTLLISATPFYFMEMKRLIERIDAQPPQVVIQVLIASVQLNNDEEFGVQFGLQSPVLFARSGLAASSTATTQTNAAAPGFGFNSTTTTPSGNLGNSSLTSPGSVGFQSLSNLGVGTSSPTQGVGGFVFQASSQSLSLLIRALKAQGRVDILSRPQVTVADNQTGYVQVGANYPYLSTSSVTATGIATQSIAYEPIGVTMRVTPRVNPDGKVLMRVEPQVANVSAGAVSLGNGIEAPAFNIQTVQTTVLASSGETIVLGGLISKQDTRSEVGWPFLKDVPYIGALFRYRQHTMTRQEVLVIMTPHIVRSEVDQARILAEESARMHSCFPDYARIHGHGMEVIGPASMGAKVVPTSPLAPGGGFFNGNPQSLAPQSGPAYFGDIQRENVSGDVLPNRLLTGQAMQESYAPQQRSSYVPGQNAQPVYYNPGVAAGSNAQPAYNPAAIQGQTSQPAFLPNGAQPPIAAPPASGFGQPMALPGSAAMQPSLVPGVPMPPGTPSLVPQGPVGMQNQPRFQQPTQSGVSLASATYPAQPTLAGPAASMPQSPLGPLSPVGNSPPGASNFRMEMPNGQPLPSDRKLPDMAPGISGPNFMRMQQQAPQNQPQAPSAGAPANRTSSTQGNSSQDFMQPPQYGSGVPVPADWNANDRFVKP